ncbi:glycine receptor subunit alphaZ1-like isoform X2 [Ptychodera flava]|uniref:glycine receptor subunit alphaZ1-like isoform X2 n=1 Tax=Ptychodera flava TaxID=63121 RepID=UPI00396A107F
MGAVSSADMKTVFYVVLAALFILSSSNVSAGHRIPRQSVNTTENVDVTTEVVGDIDYNATQSGVIFTSLHSHQTQGHDPHYDMDKALSHMLDQLLEGYDSRVRPNPSGPPVMVSTSIYVISGFSTVAATMDFNLMAFIRQRWNDPRLKFSGKPTFSLSVNPQLVDKLWVPDMFFTNEKDGKLHQLTVKNEALRIYPNGDVLLSMRVSLTLACNMDLRYYPMDVQICHLTMESYGFRTRDLLFQWVDENAIDINEELEIAEFREPEVKTLEYNKTYTTGVFSALRVSFKLRRIHEYQVLQTYVPVTTFVIISWFSFWICPEAAPARVSLCITTVLTVTALSTGIRSELPHVAYVKAIDLWMTVCLVFVFASLGEYALVNYLLTEKKRRKDAQKKRAEKLMAAESAKDMELEDYAENHNGRKQSLDSEDEDDKDYFIATWVAENVNPRKVDKISRVVFPILFIIFNIFYWPICLASYNRDPFADITADNR